jgi:hypothetical protein
VNDYLPLTLDIKTASIPSIYRASARKRTSAGTKTSMATNVELNRLPFKPFNTLQSPLEGGSISAIDNPLPISADRISDPSSTPSETAKVFPSEDLPFETRGQIFAEVDYRLGGRPAFGRLYYFQWNGSMPPLVVALRPLRLYYQYLMVNI